MITLTHHDLRLTIAPELGGSVLSFQKGATDLLRNGEQATSPLEGAGFPLVPFAGRVTKGQFSFGRTDVQLAANFPPEPHAIHGDGWQSVWAVEDEGPSHLTIAHCYRPAPLSEETQTWPWAYKATQKFRLTDQGLSLTISIENQGAAPMPAGIGWHPYFPNHNARLTANTDGLEGTQSVDTLDLDTVMSWPDRMAALDLNGTVLTITASDALNYLTIYTPPGAAYFCAEPWSHDALALNSAAPETRGIRVLGPGERFSGEIALSIVA